VPSRGRPEGGWDYAVKDGDVVAGGLPRPGSGGLPSVENIWSSIVDAQSREEFLELVRTLAPKEFVLRHKELLEYADRYYAERIEPYVGPDGIEFELGMVPELAGWRGELAEADSVGGKCTAALEGGQWLAASCYAPPSVAYFRVLFGSRCSANLFR